MRRGVGLAVAFAVVVPAFAAAPDAGSRPDRSIERRTASARAEPVDLEGQGPVAARARAFVARAGGTWDVAVDHRTGRAVRVSGSGIPWIAGRRSIDLESLEVLARKFLAEQGAWLEPEVGELVLDREASSVGPDQRVIGLRFAWRVSDVPVEDAAVYLLLNSGNLVLFGAPLVGHAPGDPRPVLAEQQAIARAIEHGGDSAAYELRGAPALRFQPEENGEELLTYRLVWIVRYRVPGQIETWDARIDARTGDVVSFVDSNRYGRMVGGVYPRTWFEHNETRVPMPYGNVTTEQGLVSSDTSGAFPYPGGVASAALHGPWFEIECAGCTSPIDPLATVSGGIGRLDFGFGGVDALGNGTSTPADRMAYYHLNQVRRIAKQWLPGVGWLDQVLFAHTNYPATCNAFYDGDVYFFRSGQGCGNTGEVSDVEYHEWGHGLDSHTLDGDGATGEGTADVVSMHLTHSPLMGPGFFVDGSPVRNLDPNGPRGLLTTSNIGTKCPRTGSLGPLGFELHCEGEILGQTAWDLAQALVARHGARTGWREAERLFFTALPYSQGYLPTSFPSVYDGYLLADDTDGNLSNGTPNGIDIYNAFSRHGIAGTNHGATAYCSRPAQPVLTVTPACDRIDLLWTSVTGAARYVVLRQEPGVEALFEVATIVPPAPRTYSDHEVLPGASYGYVVLAETAAGCESRIESPITSQVTPQPILTATGVAVTDTNGSGYADPGEDVDLSITLANVGSTASGGGTGTLTSTSPVTLLDASASWPGIAAGSSAANQDALRFRTSSGIACAETLRFRLQPTAGGACTQESSWIDVSVGNPQGVCEPSPPCSTPPTFAGLASAAAGPGCGQVTLSWAAATRNCMNSFVRYSVYRSTSAGFVPSPDNLVASAINATTWIDTGLWGGVTYFYIVRAVDSLGGGETNLVRLPVVPPTGPDLGPPVFAGLLSASPGQGCGVVALSWSPALEECGPVTYDVYRSPDDEFFLPGPPTFIGSTTSISFEDSGLPAYTDFWYIVRARDSAGNEAGPDISLAVQSSAIDRVMQHGSFELTDEGWAFDSSSTATKGNWEMGNPYPAPPFQSGDCSEGTRCWITGVQPTTIGGQENDVDGGYTVLVSAWVTQQVIEPIFTPAFEYSYWVAGHPSTRVLVEVRSQSFAPTPFQELGELAPLASPMWRRKRHMITSNPEDGIQFRFTASAFSLSSSDEAGIDDWALIDVARDCLGCPTPTQPLNAIRGSRVDQDVVLDWSQGATTGSRFGVYVATTPTFQDAVFMGTTSALSFTHFGAAFSPQDLYYLVTAFDQCGNESALH